MLREHRGAEIHINVDEVDTDTRRFYNRHGFLNIEPGADYRMLCAPRGRFTNHAHIAAVSVRRRQDASSSCSTCDSAVDAG